MGFFRFFALFLLLTPAFAESALDKKLSELKSTSDPAKIQVLERELSTLFEQSPSKTVSLLMQRTTLAMQKNEPDLALHLLETINEIAPTYAASYARRAIIKASQSREGEAISELEIALKYQPRDYRSLAQLGFLFIKLEREKEALKAFDLALDLHPNFTQVKTTADKLRLKLEGAKL